MLLFKTIKQIFSNHFQCTFPLRSTFVEFSFLLKEYYSIKLLTSAPRVTNRVIYLLLVYAFNCECQPACDKPGHLLIAFSKHFECTFPLRSTFLECSFLLKEYYRFSFFECSFSKRLKKSLRIFNAHFP